MQPLMNQELARIRYAEVIREATRHHQLTREEPRVVERPGTTRRLLRTLRPALTIG